MAFKTLREKKQLKPEHYTFNPHIFSVTGVGLLHATDLLKLGVQVRDCHSEFIFSVQL